jgi:NAD(P)-dependent dehydrogenase (short-subunit alcohol dehydrogenase family)
VFPGVSDAAPALTQRIAEFERNFKVNALGPVVLFQSFYDLLSKSTKPEKKFIVTSTALGSQAMAGAGPFAAYGMSKAAVNHFGLKVHKEHGEKDKLVVVLVHPG